MGTGQVLWACCPRLAMRDKTQFTSDEVGGPKVGSRAVNGFGSLLRLAQRWTCKRKRKVEWPSFFEWSAPLFMWRRIVEAEQPAMSAACLTVTQCSLKALMARVSSLKRYLHLSPQKTRLARSVSNLSLHWRQARCSLSIDPSFKIAGSSCRATAGNGISRRFSVFNTRLILVGQS